jgi:hypothetical protein
VIGHIVLFNPAAPMSAEEEDALVESLSSAVRQCPTVIACRIGRRVRHGRPGYEQAMREDYPYALQLDFADVEGLLAYLAHPAHAALGDAFARSSSLAYDYDLREVDR